MPCLMTGSGGQFVLALFYRTSSCVSWAANKATAGLMVVISERPRCKDFKVAGVLAARAGAEVNSLMAC